MKTAASAICFIEIATDTINVMFTMSHNSMLFEVIVVDDEYILIPRSRAAVCEAGLCGIIARSGKCEWITHGLDGWASCMEGITGGHIIFLWA